MRGEFLLMPTLVVAVVLGGPRTSAAEKPAKASLQEASPPQSEQLQAAVRRLVQELDAPELAVRQRAQQQLIELGPEILPLLPEPASQPSAERRRRLTEVHDQLQRMRALGALQPARVTLHGEGLTLQDVLSAIRKQTHNPVGDYRDHLDQPLTEIRLDVQFDQTPFWQALDEVRQQSGMRFYLESGKGDIGLVAGPEEANPHVQYAGPLRLEPTDIELHRDLRGGGLAACTLTMDVMWEPRLHPIYFKYSMADIQAADEQGRVIAPASSDAASEMSPSPLFPKLQLAITFQPPPRTSQRIARLHGTLRLGVPVQMTTFRFPKLADSKDRTIQQAGLSVTLASFRQDDFQWRARVLLQYDETVATDVFESYRIGWLNHNEAYLENAQGERFELNGGFNYVGFGKGSAEVEYIFVDVPGPVGDYTLVYQAPGVILELPVEFELTDLPLP